MQIPTYKRWWLRLATFSLAALAAASAAYWVLKYLGDAPQSTPPALALATPSGPDSLSMARALGGGQSGVVSSSPIDNVAARFKLMGVVLEGSKTGYALIAVDSKPARPYRLGAAVSEGLVLKSLVARSAALASSMEAPASVTLELPKINPL
jgi:general secretion pathway protein C